MAARARQRSCTRINPGVLILLLQLAFAEHLAQHINTTGVINPGEVLAELPADPVMAGVLQQVVRPGTASPRPPTVATAAPGPRAPSRGAGCSRRLPQAGRRSQQGTQQGEALVAPVLPIVSLEPPALQRQEQQQQEQRQHAAPPADEQEDEGMPDALSPVADHAEQQAAQAYPRAEEAGAAGGQPAPSEQAAARMPAAGVVAESGAHAALTGRQPSRAGERVALEGPAAMGSACTAPEQLPDSRQPGPADMVANTPAAAASQQPAASEPAAASEAPAACMSPRMASQQGPAEAAGQLLAGQQQAGSPSRHAEAAQRQVRWLQGRLCLHSASCDVFVDLQDGSKKGLTGTRVSQQRSFKCCTTCRRDWTLAGPALLRRQPLRQPASWRCKPLRQWQLW